MAAALLASHSSAQSIRINGPLAQELRTGSVGQNRFTADGARLVYRADRAQAGVFELFSVLTNGSAPSVRLNGTLPAGGMVRSGPEIGAGNRVIYTADQTTPGVRNLYSVAADGSASAVLLSTSSISSWWLNPAGDHVYFSISGQNTTLQRVPIDGSGAPSLVATFPSFPLAVSFSASGNTLLVRSFGALDTFLLSSVPADGSGPSVPLHQTAAGNLLNDIRFAPDGIHAVFEEVQLEGIFFPNSLYSVRLDGSAPAVRLNPNVNTYSPNGYTLDASAPQRLVFRDCSAVYSIAFDGTQLASLMPAGWQAECSFLDVLPSTLAVHGADVVFEAFDAVGYSLLRAPLDGSQVGAPLFPPGATGGRYPVILSSGKVVALAAAGIYTVPLAGGTPLFLAPRVTDFLVHPNGTDVVFRSDVATSGKDELYAVKLDGSQAQRKLSGPLLPAGGDVVSYSITPDGLSVAYHADPLTDNVFGVFHAPLAGLGPVVQYNDAVPGTGAGGDVLEFQCTRDGKKVVYRADEDLDERFDLFAAGTFGRGTRDNLTASLPASVGVRPGFVLSPSGERALFQSLDQSLFSLRSAATTPGPAPIALDSSTIELPLPLAISPDGTRAAYRKSAIGANDFALRSAPLDGSSPALTLHAPLAAGRSVVDFQIDADSRFVVHRADEDLDNVFELFSVPLDGSAPPVRLHPPLPAGRTVPSYRISPDGKHVVFLADLELAGRLDLWSVPTDGRPPLRKLDQDMLATRDVLDFVIAPDGRSVAYRANALSSSRIDLFVVPIEGARPAARRESGEVRDRNERILLSKLSGTRVLGSDYAFTPDGTRLLFRANHPLATSRFDLFRVPADGSAVPVQISGFQAGTRTISSFAVSPDQSRVVYLSDAAVNDVFELFSVPLAGGPAVRLDPLPAFGDVSSYRIDPRSARVVYLADGKADNVMELFAAPLDGSAPRERLNGSLPANADVEADFIPLGGRTLWRADQGTNDVLELFVSLERPVFPR